MASILFYAAQVVVQVPYQLWDFRTQSQVRRNSKIWAHDEYELVNEGDVVRRRRSCLPARALLLGISLHPRCCTCA